MIEAGFLYFIVWRLVFDEKLHWRLIESMESCDLCEIYRARASKAQVLFDIRGRVLRGLCT